MYTRDAFPWDCARTQHNMGLAFSKLQDGRRRENLESAASAFRSALMVYTRETFPAEQTATAAALEETTAALAALAPTTEPPPSLPPSRRR